MFNIDEVVKATMEMPPLSPSATRLAGLVQRPDVDLNEVIEVVSLDPGLTGALLRGANSASHGATRKIGVVRDAVMRLGTGATLALAIAGQVRAQMQRPMPEFELDEGMLWRHSVAAALAAELARSSCKTPVPPEAFTAALLHDLGKLVLVRFLDPEVVGWLWRARDEGQETGHRAEIEILGCHHGELGEMIARSWGMPETVCKAIAYHHSPSDCEAVTTDVVHLADIVAKRIGMGSHRDIEEAAFDAGSADRLGVSTEEVSALCDRAAGRLDDVLARYDS